MAAEDSRSQPVRLRLMVVGDGGVGKSCFITQFVEGKYVTDHPPSQWKREQRFQKRLHTVVVDGVSVELEIMELNDELFRLTDAATEAIYPDAMIADCYVYLFNLAKKDTLHRVDSWKHEMDRYNVGPHRKHSVWLMAGHKITEQDYAGFITQAKAKATAMNMKFEAVNSRDGENVELAVLTLVADTMVYQTTHRHDPIDPWATPTSDIQQPFFPQGKRGASPLLESHDS